MSGPTFGTETCLCELLDQVKDPALDPGTHKDIINNLSYLVIAASRTHAAVLECQHQSCDLQSRVKRDQGEVEVVATRGTCRKAALAAKLGKLSTD